jgi:hypothetical protein
MGDGTGAARSAFFEVTMTTAAQLERRVEEIRGNKNGK